MVSDVSNDPQRVWPYFRGENSPTASSVPFTFRDGITTMEKIEALSCEFSKLVGIMKDYTAYSEQWKQDTTDKLDKNMSAFQSAVNDKLDDMMTIIQGLYGSVLEYNPTTGAYEDSQKVQRDMFRDLAVFGARVDQTATLTCDEMSKHTVQETAVVGNLTIFGNMVPRVTPVSGGEQE